MSLLVTGGAILKCSFGAAPSTLEVLPTNHVVVELPAANIINETPLLNILPFGVCTSLANPEVAAATAAALGVLVPMPCLPVTVAPWVTGTPTVLIGNMPALNNDSKLMCCWAGVISITYAGQVKVSLS